MPQDHHVTHQRRQLLALGASDFQKLHLYASHAISPDFRRKSVAMQREIVGVVTRLHVQCLSWAGAQSPMEVAAMKMAIAVMQSRIGSV